MAQTCAIMSVSHNLHQLYTSKLESAAPSLVAGVSQSIAAALSSIRQVGDHSVKQIQSQNSINTTRPQTPLGHPYLRASSRLQKP